MSSILKHIGMGVQELLEEFEFADLGVTDVWRHEDEVYFTLEYGDEYVIRAEKVKV